MTKLASVNQPAAIDAIQNLCYLSLLFTMTASQNQFTVFGNQPLAVLKEIKDRQTLGPNLTLGSRPAKLGLIIEGGAMRGIIAGGFLVAVHELGLKDIFETIYGTSAGAVGGAYFLSGQAPYGAGIYYEEVNNEQFINFRTMPPFFDIDYLIQIVANKKKLDVKAIKKHPTNLLITATEIITGKPHYFSNHEEVDLLTAIKASCALPIYYDKPVRIGDYDYLDGGIVSSLPIDKAIMDGCTHILILMTDNPDRRMRATYLPFWFELWRLRKYSQEFIATYFGRPNNFAKTMAVIRGEHERSHGIAIAAVAPLNTDLHAYSSDAEKLKQAFAASYDFMLGILK